MKKLLKQYYGYTDFRPGQKEIIEAVLFRIKGCHNRLPSGISDSGRRKSGIKSGVVGTVNSKILVGEIFLSFLQTVLNSSVGFQLFQISGIQTIVEYAGDRIKVGIW